MKVAIAYPLPFDNWTLFRPFVERFTTTLKQFPAGHPFELYACCCDGEPTDHVREMFYDLRTRFFDYRDGGCDIGSAQALSKTLPPDTFLICMTSRVYFHRAHWLRRYVQAREIHGDALYSPFASHETAPHIGTRGYALDAGTFAKYPHLIDHREKGQKFECGEWSLTHWFRKQGKGCWQVTWDGEQEQADWRKPDNIFRKGNQEQCLLWDKHTDIYADASPEEKVKLQAVADNGYGDTMKFCQHGTPEGNVCGSCALDTDSPYARPFELTYDARHVAD